jgi:general stress protein 26
MSDKTKGLEQKQNTTGTRAELRDLLREFDLGILVTRDEQSIPRGRPMAVAGVDDDGTLWFLSPEHMPKVREIERDAMVAAIFSRDRDKAWVSVSGRASLVKDRKKIGELWKPTMGAWFEGPNDPAIVLIRVEPQHAEYYEPNKGPVGRVFELVKGVVTGQAPSMGAVKHVEKGDLERLSEPGRLSH